MHTESTLSILVQMINWPNKSNNDRDEPLLPIKPDCWSELPEEFNDDNLKNSSNVMVAQKIFHKKAK